MNNSLKFKFRMEKSMTELREEIKKIEKLKMKSFSDLKSEEINQNIVNNINEKEDEDSDSSEKNEKIDKENNSSDLLSHIIFVGFVIFL